MRSPNKAPKIELSRSCWRERCWSCAPVSVCASAALPVSISAAAAVAVYSDFMAQIPC
ncbi:hypothetical protein [Blastomonas sp. UPD001]|uniref:hypothetical protein n=1 Tax=Blastomonas sp. UPD001 TaxID=2217673 RepID=UPI001E5BDB85|nr:hypothetical protein [Blastomonas sp. UPD001]